MKKLLSILLVLTLVLASSTVAFAAPEVIGSPSVSPDHEFTGTAPVTVDKDVSITLDPYDASTTVYKVDIEWGNLNFVYNGGSQGTWNPEDEAQGGHSYTSKVDAGWSHEAADITITNHSNAVVYLKAVFDVTDTETYKGTIVNDSNDKAVAYNGITLQIAGSDVALANDALDSGDECPNTKYTVQIADPSIAPTEDFFTMAKVCLTISALPIA